MSALPTPVLRSGARCLLILWFLSGCWGISGCLPLGRALTYPATDPVLDTDWFQPQEIVPGYPAAWFPRARPDEIDPSFRRALEEVSAYAWRRRSCALIVLYRGRVVWERTWCGLDSTSRLNAMSLHKAVLALLVGVAIDEGHIRSVEQSAADFLPEWAGDDRRKITIEHLLQMTSGLRNEGADLTRLHLGTGTADLIAELPATGPPGRAFDYNNLNSQALGLILERATGQRYAGYLGSRLWQPLGAAPAAVWLDRPGGLARTYCCLLASARDWARIGQLLVDDGRVGDRVLVPAGWIGRMSVPSLLEENFGYGLWLGRSWPKRRRAHWSEPFAAPDTLLLVGRAEQRVYAVPSRSLVIVRLGRETAGWDDPWPVNALVRALDGKGL